MLALPDSVLAGLWRLAKLPDEALTQVRLTGSDPVFPSSFAVGTAAQSSIAAAALAACELGFVRGQARQGVQVDMLHAAAECTTRFSLDGRTSDIWDPFSGLYQCTDGWVRVHANFAHHREGALRLMGLKPATATRSSAELAMLTRSAWEFEEAAAQAGLVVAALRSFAQWDAHPQAAAVAALPLFTIERIGDADPILLPALHPRQRPLENIKILELTRILAGPVCGKVLAAYGADVMLLNSPHLPNIEAIADTSRGKRSAHVDLRTNPGANAMRSLLSKAHVWMQGYRPGALAALGWSPREVASIRPGIVCASLSAYGNNGPWAHRRGFDSLVQTATGFNDAEGQALGGTTPKAFPMQILDHASGYIMAMAIGAALGRQQVEGGSWHVQVSLAQTAQWLRGMGRIDNGFSVPLADMGPYLESSHSGFGELRALRHSAQLSRTPAAWTRPSMPPGTHAAAWD